jgi:hypothetical protein
MGQSARTCQLSLILKRRTEPGLSVPVAGSDGAAAGVKVPSLPHSNDGAEESPAVDECVDAHNSSMRLTSVQRFGFQLRALSDHPDVMADKTEVVVFNHDFESGVHRAGARQLQTLTWVIRSRFPFPCS